MVTNNAKNQPTAATGKVLQGQGVGTTSAFSTATYPATATTTGQVLRADGTNWSGTTATYPNTAGTSGNVLTSDGTNWNSSPASVINPLAIFGDGSDGSPTFDGAATVLGVAPSSNTYTQNRDWFMASPTINNGVSIITNGYRIFCSGTCTNNGTIQWNGNNASTSTAGGSLTNANCTINKQTLNFGLPGGNGGNGATGAGSSGQNVTAVSIGGAGGAGGSGTSGAGGAAGTQGQVVPANCGNIRALPWAGMGQVTFNSPAFSTIIGGTGGGGGGGNGTNAGGGGGGGAAIVIVAANTFSGTGTISANGGTGGNGTASNCGGGGGGGGGVVCVTSTSASAGSISGQTITANGGTHGNSGGGSGNAGSNGNPGLAVVLHP